MNELASAAAGWLILVRAAVFFNDPAPMIFVTVLYRKFFFPSFTCFLHTFPLAGRTTIHY